MRLKISDPLEIIMIKLSKILPIVSTALALVALVGVGYIYATPQGWVSPTTPPPPNLTSVNVEAPVNVGTSIQTKNGELLATTFTAPDIYVGNAAGSGYGYNLCGGPLGKIMLCGSAPVQPSTYPPTCNLTGGTIKEFNLDTALIDKKMTWTVTAGAPNDPPNNKFAYNLDPSASQISGGTNGKIEKGGTFASPYSLTTLLTNITPGSSVNTETIPSNSVEIKQNVKTSFTISGIKDIASPTANNCVNNGKTINFDWGWKGYYYIASKTANLAQSNFTDENILALEGSPFIGKFHKSALGASVSSDSTINLVSLKNDSIPSNTSGYLYIITQDGTLGGDNGGYKACGASGVNGCGPSRNQYNGVGGNNTWLYQITTFKNEFYNSSGANNLFSTYYVYQTGQETLDSTTDHFDIK